MPSENTWHSRWLSMAFEVASWSKDPSSKHGCIIVSNNRAISFGYNGMPEKTDDNILNTNDKYSVVQHSEGNAITNAARCGHCTNGSTAYVTGQPCPHCLGLLINGGMRRLVYHPLWTTILSEDDRWLSMSQLFSKLVKEAKVELIVHKLVSSPKTAFFKGKEYDLEVEGYGM